MASSSNLYWKYQVGSKRSSLSQFCSRWLPDLHMVTQTRKECLVHQRPWFSRHWLQMEPLGLKPRHCQSKRRGLYNFSKQRPNSKNLQHSQNPSWMCLYSSSWLPDNKFRLISRQPATCRRWPKQWDLHMVNQRPKNDEMFWKTSKRPNSGRKHAWWHHHWNHWHQLVQRWHFGRCRLREDPRHARYEENPLLISWISHVGKHQIVGVWC